MLEYKIKENSVLVNQKIKECAFPSDTIIVGITRNSELSIPTGDTVFEKDDKVIFMGLSHALDKLAGTFFHEKGFVKSVSIIGGGSIGLMLAKNLEEIKIKTKIIEKNIQRCEKIAQELSNTLVINGDCTNLSLLNEE